MLRNINENGEDEEGIWKGLNKTELVLLTGLTAVTATSLICISIYCCIRKGPKSRR